MKTQDFQETVSLNNYGIQHQTVQVPEALFCAAGGLTNLDGQASRRCLVMTDSW